MAFTGGLSFKRGNGELVDETFSDVTEIYNLSPVGTSKSLNKITGWDSDIEEFENGFAEGNDITIECMRVLDDPVQEAMINDVDNDITSNYQLLIDDNESLEKFEFKVVLNKWSATPSNQDKNIIVYSGKINSVITRTIENSPNAGGEEGSTNYRDAILFLDPIDYWRLNETSGTSAANLGSGSEEFAAQPIVYSSDAGTSGYSDNLSIYVDGTGKAINGLLSRLIKGASHEAGFRMAGYAGFSIELVLKINSASAGDVIVSYWDESSVETADKSWRLRVSPSDANKIIFEANFSENEDPPATPTYTLRTLEVVSSISALGGNPFHINIGYEYFVQFNSRVNSVLTDSIDASEWTENYLPAFGTTSIFQIGSDNVTPVEATIFDGVIDEISLHGGYFTDAEIKRNYDYWKTGLGDPIV